MRINEFEQKRLKNRIHGWDYSENGWYSVTICVHHMIQCFGKVENGKMKLNKFGEIVEKCWKDLPNHYWNCELNIFQIMPNHVHGIIIIDIPNRKLNNVVTGFKPVTTINKIYPISEIIRGFKTFSSRNIHQTGFTNFSWQRSFYDRVIRNETELLIKQKYIMNNPLKWELDKYNPRRIRIKKIFD